MPPATELARVVVSPAQTDAVPVMAAGNALTVTAVVLKQVLLPVIVIVAAPAATPVTMPVAEPTVAIPIALLVHVPALLVSVVVEPAHTDAVPLIVVGKAFTVSALVV